MSNFAEHCASRLSHLHSATLALSQKTPLVPWTSAVLALLASAPLDTIRIASTDAVFEAAAFDMLWTGLVTQHYTRLVRFSAHRMLVSPAALADICERCTALEELFVSVERESLVRLCSLPECSLVTPWLWHSLLQHILGPCLARARKVRLIHLSSFKMGTAAHAAMTNEKFFQSVPEVSLSLARQCGPTVKQFGCNTHVWQVS
jgi:hypothetical protein